MPDWAQRRPLETPNRNTLFSYNRRLVAAANTSGTVFDVAFYGDSLTGLTVLSKDCAIVFNTFFNSSEWLTARLGVGGSTVEELTWRLLANG